jgi:surface protein
MNNIFFGCSSLKQLPDISKWDLENVIDVSFMFGDCTSLLYLPEISKWKTSNIENMSHLFYRTSSLKTLPDLSKWDISNVKNIEFIFAGFSSKYSFSDLPSSLDKDHIMRNNDIINKELLKLLIESNKKDLDFINDSLEVLRSNSIPTFFPDISNWDTKNVSNMNGIFAGCSTLTSLPDISKWDISKVTNMKAMFYECESLQCFSDISNWNIINNPNINKENMFYGCKKSNITCP